MIEKTVLSESVLYKPNVEANADYGEQFLVLWRQILGKTGDGAKTVAALQRGMDSNFFSEKISRINSKLADALGENLARAYQIASTGKNNYLLYATNLRKEQITYI